MTSKSWDGGYLAAMSRMNNPKPKRSKFWLGVGITAALILGGLIWRMTK